MGDSTTTNGSSPAGLLDDAPRPVAEPPAIDVQGVSASYHVRMDGKRMLDDLRNLLSRRATPDRLIPAVRDVSFQVPKGSVFAIIGRNGAGKSTLLRVVAGLLPPEEGRVVVRGRVSLLAMGIGMSQDLTGRENIKLGGLALGIDAKRLDELTDEIAEFAQLGEYLDFPLRTYSAGMRSRLGVAVSAHLDPEVLLIDEALTGGDAAFQRHVSDKIEALTGSGRTVVLVSHGLSSVRSMATEAMWMHQGRVAELGDVDEVVNKYMRYCRLESLEEEEMDEL